MIDIDDPTMKLLKGLPNFGGAVFQNRQGRRLKYQGLRKLMDKLEKRTGIKTNAHKFRRTHITMALAKGAPLFFVQAQVGHRQAETTRGYMVIKAEDKLKAHKKYGPLSEL